jgi:endonuclease-8
MPEGDTLYRTAVTLRKALAGRTVTRFETSLEHVAAVDRRTPVTGRVVAAVEARGKHLLITLSGGTNGRNTSDENATPFSRRSPEHPSTRPYGRPDGRTPEHPDDSATGNEQPVTDNLIIHTHLRMTGSWHVYRPGEAWRKPARLAKVVLHTHEFVTPCFSAPVVELLTEWQARRHPELVGLGPDAITEEFDLEEALARLRRRPDVEIGVALMNQRLVAGVGNVYKSEVLFLQRVSPFRKIAELDEGTLTALIAEAHRLLRLNRDRGARRTLFGLREEQRLWVYGRSGEPCRACGETIRMRRQGLDGRSTYYCSRCQQA